MNDGAYCHWCGRLVTRDTEYECVDETCRKQRAAAAAEPTPRFARRPCKGCGKMVVWAIGPNGPVPLDPVPAVYTVEVVDGVVRARRAGAAMVGHHVTCPRREQFSRKAPARAGRGGS